MLNEYIFVEASEIKREWYWVKAVKLLTKTPDCKSIKNKISSARYKYTLFLFLYIFAFTSYIIIKKICVYFKPR